jgi:hypothetical protein
MPFGGALVVYVNREPSVVIDLLIDLDAFLAHSAFARYHSPYMTTEGVILFIFAN